MSTRTPTITLDMSIAAEKILDTVTAVMQVPEGDMFGTSRAAVASQYITCRILQKLYGISEHSSAKLIGVEREAARKKKSYDGSPLSPGRVGFVNVEAAWQVAEALSGTDRETALRGGRGIFDIACRKIMYRMLRSFFGMSQDEARAVSCHNEDGERRDDLRDSIKMKISSLDVETLPCSSTM